MPPRPTEPEALLFADDGVVPDNAQLPFLVYRCAIDLIGTADPERWSSSDPVFGKQGPLLRLWRN